MEVTFENPADNSGFIGIDCYLAVQPNVIAIAPALGHLGGTPLETLSQAIFELLDSYVTNPS